LGCTLSKTLRAGVRASVILTDSWLTNQTASAAPSSDIRDIKPPLEIAGGWAWLWITLGVLAGVIILVALWKWWRKRQTDIAVVPPVPAHVRAKQKLAEALGLIAQPKPFVIAVSDAARAYLEERFDFRAPERTTEEFLRELSGTDRLVPRQKDSLGNFLAGCDLVKFAKYEPHEAELRELHGAALKLVEETEPVEIKTEVGSVPASGEKVDAASTMKAGGETGEPPKIINRQS
jgi:hypothetical protein